MTESCQQGTGTVNKQDQDYDQEQVFAGHYQKLKRAVAGKKKCFWGSYFLLQDICVMIVFYMMDDVLED